MGGTEYSGHHDLPGPGHSVRFCRQLLLHPAPGAKDPRQDPQGHLHARLCPGVAAQVDFGRGPTITEVFTGAVTVIPPRPFLHPIMEKYREQVIENYRQAVARSYDVSGREPGQRPGPCIFSRPLRGMCPVLRGEDRTSWRGPGMRHHRLKARIPARAKRSP